MYAGIYTRVLLLPIIKSSLDTTSRLFKLQVLHTGDLITTFFCHIPKGCGCLVLLRLTLPLASYDSQYWGVASQLRLKISE